MLRDLLEIHKIVNFNDPKGMGTCINPTMCSEYYAECYSVLNPLNEKISVSEFMSLLLKELRENFAHSFKTPYNIQSLKNLEKDLNNSKFKDTFK
jgi:hypothetical protein